MVILADSIRSVASYLLTASAGEGVRRVEALATPPLGPLPGSTEEIQVDGLYGHLWGPLPRHWRRHSYALLFAANRDPACPEKVIGAVLAAAEAQAGYRSLGALLLS